MENNNKWDKVESVLTRVHDFLGRLCRDGRCDDHCSECFGASNIADDVWDVLHVLKQPPRNCDKYLSLKEALAAWRETPPYESGCFDEWLFATAKNGEVDDSNG